MKAASYLGLNRVSLCCLQSRAYPVFGACIFLICSPGREHLLKRLAPPKGSGMRILACLSKLLLSHPHCSCNCIAFSAPSLLAGNVLPSVSWVSQGDDASSSFIKHKLLFSTIKVFHNLPPYLPWARETKTPFCSTNRLPLIVPFSNLSSTVFSLVLWRHPLEKSTGSSSEMLFNMHLFPATCRTPDNC